MTASTLVINRTPRRHEQRLALLHQSQVAAARARSCTTSAQARSFYSLPSSISEITSE